MRAAVAAGKHDHLIEIQGQLTGAPDNKPGLVLSLVPDDYSALGNVPNFETCTRDTYPEGTAFSVPFILNLLQGVAAASAHIHNRGLMHGDIYAHNILPDKTGNALLGDFGAASFSTAMTARRRESLDVRAFGCLMEDMLDRLTAEDSATRSGEVTRLRALQHDCMNENPATRPQFEDIKACVNGLGLGG